MWLASERMVGDELCGCLWGGWISYKEGGGWGRLRFERRYGCVMFICGLRVIPVHYLGMTLTMGLQGTKASDRYTGFVIPSRAACDMTPNFRSLEEKSTMTLTRRSNICSRGELMLEVKESEDIQETLISS